jgi:excisionase family DNA binding protein
MISGHGHANDIRHGHGQTGSTVTDTFLGQEHDADIMVTAEEAARLVDVSARTVRRWVAKGEIQAEESVRGHLLSVTDVRLRAARGHVRTRPSSTAPTVPPIRRTSTDTVMSEMSSVLSPVLIAHAEQVERLTREAMTEKARADAAEREVEQLSRELLQALIAGSSRELSAS